MVGIYTETRMRMEHFHDFYYLEAVRAAITTSIASDPDLEFSKPVSKLMNDLEGVEEKLIPNMALRVFMYLYASCLGEARHARDNTARERFLTNTIKKNRSDLFGEIVKYPPTKQNLETLASIFDQEWRSGYGGDAWLSIARALLEYDTTPPAAWIDHVVDLEHNNGTVFSKPDGQNSIMFDVSYPHRFGSFLDYKFRKNILMHSPPFTLDVSPRIYNLVERFCVLFKRSIPKFLNPSLDNLSDYRVEWGDEVLADSRKWSDWANVLKGNKPDIKLILHECGGNRIFPPSMYIDEIEKILNKAQKRAIESIGEYATPYTKAAIKKYTLKLLEEYRHTCKLPKAEKTYEVLPCTVTSDKKSITLHFEIPYQEGYGEKTDDGFTVKDKMWSTLQGKGYVVREYGAVVLWLKDKSKSNHYWVSNQTLEALLA